MHVTRLERAENLSAYVLRYAMRMLVWASTRELLVWDNAPRGKAVLRLPPHKFVAMEDAEWSGRCV